ncbi:MAG: methyltransferase domain-containing protein [Verrucomicrobia bacterium]|nr:methyltransferase domain-containing protein [Verrucomicrobiota bacterium]
MPDATITRSRAPFAGVAQILRFNWPWYAVAIAGNGVVAFLLTTRPLPRPITLVICVALAFANFWLLASLFVSHYVYDRSGIARASWLETTTTAPARVATIHAGHDEASNALQRQFPAAQLFVYSVFDALRTRTPSIARAQARAGQDPRMTAIPLQSIPLDDAQLDLACLVFAAHEIRLTDDRVALFSELRRVLNPDGRVVIVEHLRDSWNALAFGPGAFHFLARATWLHTFAAAGLHLADQRRITPFVTVFTLRRTT